MLDIIRKRAKQLKVTNVHTVRGTISDPKLPANAVDVMLMVDVYHEFDHPYEMIESMLKSLKTGGRLVFVEFRMEDDTVPIKLVHKMTEKQVIKEMGVFPQLKHVKTHTDMPWQHVIVFEKIEEPKKRPLGARSRITFGTGKKGTLAPDGAVGITGLVPLVRWRLFH